MELIFFLYSLPWQDGMNWICNNIVNKKKWTSIPNIKLHREPATHKGFNTFYIIHHISYMTGLDPQDKLEE